MNQLINNVLNVAFDSICLFLGASLSFYLIRIKNTTKKQHPVERETPVKLTISPQIAPFLREFKGRQFKIQQFQLPKSGNSEAEYEDRAKVLFENDTFLRVAIADGATESIFSDIWAELIVEKFVENGFLETTQLKEVYQVFIETTNKRIEKAPEMRRWTMYNKMERGTQATMAGIEFLNSESFKLTALGDSCIFYQGQNNSKIEMLPALSPEDFGNSPQAICHLPNTWERLNTQWIKQEVVLEDTFKILLCTDALAQYLTTDPTIWEALFQLNDQESFTTLIKDLLSQQVLKNDDVTLVTIDVLPLNV